MTAHVARSYLTEEETERLAALWQAMTGLRPVVEVSKRTDMFPVVVSLSYPDPEQSFDGRTHHLTARNDATDAAAHLVIHFGYGLSPNRPSRTDRSRLHEVIRHFLRTGRVTVKGLAHVAAIPHHPTVVQFLAGFVQVGAHGLPTAPSGREAIPSGNNRFAVDTVEALARMTAPKGGPVGTKEAVECAIVGAAPERAVDIHDMLHGSGVSIETLDDSAGFKLGAGAFETVVLTARTMHQFWLLGYAAWKALPAFAPLQLQTATPFDIGDDALDAMPGQLAAEASIEEALQWVEELRTAPDTASFTWPTSVPRPDAGIPAATEEHAVFDLNVIAAAYAFLHELKHVQVSIAGTVFATPWEEETACDAFARDFLLDGVPAYSRASGYDAHLVLGKRAAGIALGAFILLAVTDRTSWAGSTTHPPLAGRIRALAANVNLPPDARYWMFLASLLLAVIRRDRCLPSTLLVTDWRDSCRALLDVLEKAA